MEVYIGTICAFGFNFAPYGWSTCQGQLLPISQYAALFSLLGTYYGGNGTSNFALPNLQNRVANAQGQGAGLSQYVIGEEGGSSNVTILSSNLPPHNHGVTLSLNAVSPRGGGNANAPTGNFPASSSLNVNNFNTTVSTGSAMKPASVTLGITGGSVPISIQDPIQVLNYCISLYGIFPTRN